MAALGMQIWAFSGDLCIAVWNMDSQAHDLTLGVVFFCIAFYTFLRTLTFIHLKGKGNYVIKAFHFLICFTALLRCIWCWVGTARVHLDPMLDVVSSVGNKVDPIAQHEAIHALGTMALFATFLILCCYWSYMLEHVTLKVNVATDCFVPMHLLPESLQIEARTSTCLGRLRKTTVIELYLSVMKVVMGAAVVNLVGFLANATSARLLLRCSALLEALASASSILALTILSGRIRVLLTTYGAQNQDAIQQHMDRVLKVTVGVNSFLITRLALEMLFFYCSVSPEAWQASLLGRRDNWLAFVALKHALEAGVLVVELFVSRILSKRPANLPINTTSIQTEIGGRTPLSCDVEMPDYIGSSSSSSRSSSRSSSNSSAGGSSASYATHSSKVLAGSGKEGSAYNTPTKAAAPASERTPLIPTSLSKMAAFAAVGREGSK